MTKPASQIDLPNQYYHHELRSKEEHPADSVLSSQVDFAFVVVDTDFERSDPKWGERTVVNLYFCPLSELLNK
jgi:hypothetical protein